MNNVINDSERPGKNITWQAQLHPPPCEHHDVIAHEEGGAASNAGSLEAE
jgi:hypothetical protein